MKYFTLKEAQDLIPQLEGIFAGLLPIYAKAQTKAQRIAELESSVPDAAELAIERSQLQFLVNTVNKELAKVFELGAVFKGLDPVLVDFPHQTEGREVYLCWRLGEKRITHYHGLEEGFAGRKMLPRSVYST